MRLTEDILDQSNGEGSEPETSVESLSLRPIFPFWGDSQQTNKP